MQSPTSASNGWAEVGEDFCPRLWWCERTFPFPLTPERLDCSKVGNSAITSARRSGHGEGSTGTPRYSNSSAKAKCPSTLFLSNILCRAGGLWCRVLPWHSRTANCHHTYKAYSWSSYGKSHPRGHPVCQPVLDAEFSRSLLPAVQAGCPGAVAG